MSFALMGAFFLALGSSPGYVSYECWAAEPTPSATVTETATASATGTQRPSDTPSATPTGTPTPRTHWRIYVPVLERRDHCERQTKPVSVALVLDMSTSMYRETDGGVTKHRAALDAAASFIDHLRLDAGDRVAIVGYNNAAWLEQGLTSNEPLLLGSLPRLLPKIVEGTRLDLAIEEGGRAVAGEELPVVILLTDGLPNRVPIPPGGRQEDTVLAATDRVKAAGARVYTIGLGRDVSDWLLERMATTPELYYPSPTGDDLKEIYRQLAVEVRECLPVAENPPSGGEDSTIARWTNRPENPNVLSSTDPDVAEPLDEDELLYVGHRPGADPEALADLVGGRYVPTWDQPGVYAILAPGGAGDATILAAHPMVRYAEPLIRYDIPETPMEPVRRERTPGLGRSISDRYFPYQYHLSDLMDGVVRVGSNVENAWDLEEGLGVVVGVLDTGVACEHEDLRCADGPVHWSADLGRAVTPSQTIDRVGHGTHVAGIIAAPINGVGVVGVAPEARILSAQACRTTSCRSDDIAQAIRWAVDHGATTLNMSFGGPTLSGLVRDAALYAAQRGVVMVASVGNDGLQRANYPAALGDLDGDTYDDVIGVGATDTSGRLTDFSTKHSVSVVAPGTQVVSTCVPISRYGQADGTSFSAPIVAGQAALIQGYVPGIGKVQLWQAIRDTAELNAGAGGCRSSLYDHRYCGHGRVNVYESLLAASGAPAPTPGPATATSPANVPLTATPGGPVGPTATATHVPAVQTALATLTKGAAQPTGTPTPPPPATGAPTETPKLSTATPELPPGTATERAIQTAVAGTQTAMVPPDVPATLTALVPSPTTSPTPDVARRVEGTATARARMLAPLYFPIGLTGPRPTPTPTPEPWQRVEATQTAAAATAAAPPTPTPMATRCPGLVCPFERSTR